MHVAFTSLVVAFALVSMAQAADLREATFTQVVKQVTVSDTQGTKTRPAKVQGKFIAPEVLRTGVGARAELTAPDKTVTRVGSNTIFSFNPGSRTINLEKGSVLFNPPAGQGGGTVQTAAATASVLGTTIIVSFDPKVGCKLLVIEGKSKIMLPNGKSTTLVAGQMIIIPNGATQMPPIFSFIIDKTKKDSLLLSGFEGELPSDDKILAAILRQNEQLKNGELQIIRNGGDTFLIDPNTQQAYFLEQERRQQPPAPVLPPPCNTIINGA